jgi:hypothetical protein
MKGKCSKKRREGREGGREGGRTQALFFAFFL